MREPVILDMDDFDPSDTVTVAHRRLAFALGLVIDPELNDFDEQTGEAVHDHPALVELSDEETTGFYNLADGLVSRTLQVALEGDRMAVELLLHGLGHLFKRGTEGKKATDILEEIETCGVHEDPQRLLFWMQTSAQRVEYSKIAVTGVQDSVGEEIEKELDRRLADAVTLYESVLRTCLFEEIGIAKTAFPLVFTAVDADVFEWDKLPLPEEVEDEMRDQAEGGVYDERTQTFSDGGPGHPPEFDL